VVERAVVLASQTSVPVDVLPSTCSKPVACASAATKAAPGRRRIVIRNRRRLRRRKIIDQLETSDWSPDRRRRALRIPLSTLNQKIKPLNIEIRKWSAFDHTAPRHWACLF